MSDRRLEYILDLNTRQFLSHIKQATAQFEQQTGKMERSAKSGANKINRAYEILNIRPFKDVEREIKQVEAAYNRLARSGKLKAKELAAAQQQVRQRVAELRREMGVTNKQVGALRTSIGSLVTAFVALQAIRAAARFVADATRVYAEYDDVIRQAGAVSHATAEEMRQLRDISKKMGEETRYSATQAAEGLKFLGMAGFTVQQQIDALPGVLQLAAAGSMDLGDAADIATNILTGYGKQVSELGRVNDMLVATFTNSNTSLQELGSGFSYAGPVAKAAGQDFAETATVLGLFANAGFKGERGGTALRSALSRLLRPTRMVKEGMAELGWSATDANGKLKPMTQIIAELKEKGASASQIIKIFGVEAGPAMAAAIGMTTEEIERLKNKIIESAGEAQRVSKEMEDGIGGARRRLAAGWEAVKIAIGESIEQENIDLYDELTRALKENKEEIAELAVDFTKFLNTMIRAGVAVGKFVAENRPLVESLISVAAAAWGVHKALLAWRAITGVAQLVSSLGGLSTVATKLGLVGVVAFAAVEVGRLVKEIWDWNEAQKQADAAGKRLEASQARLAEKLKVISQQTGVNITTGYELHKAIREGRIQLNKSTGEWERVTPEMQKAVEAHKKASTAIKATKEDLDAFEKAAKSAYDEAIAKSEEYANKVSAFEEKLKGIRSSAEDKLRQMRRKTMSEEEAWMDRRAEAEEKLAKAKELAAKGGEANLEDAAKLAEQAKELYAGLQTEITKTVDGKEVVIKSLAETTNDAIAGFEAANGALEKIVTTQKENAEKSRDAWAAMAKDIKEQLDELAADRKANIEITVDNLNEIKKKLDELAKDRNVTIHIKETESSSPSSRSGGSRSGAAASADVLGGLSGGASATRFGAGKALRGLIDGAANAVSSLGDKEAAPAAERTAGTYQELHLIGRQERAVVFADQLNANTLIRLLQEAEVLSS